MEPITAQEVITLVGLGPGGEDYITPAARRAVAEAEVLVGGRRLLELFPAFPGETRVIDRDLEGLLGYLRERQSRRIVVLCSGDPGFFGILNLLRRNFAPERLRVIPGVSSVQLAFARAALPWAEARFFTIHGRETAGVVEAAGASRVLAVLGDPRVPAGQLAAILLGAGLRGRATVAWELAGPLEEVRRDELGAAATWERGGNYVFILEREGEEA